MMIFSNYTEFIDQIYSKLAALEINTEALSIDHIGYQADSAKDYDTRISELDRNVMKINEHIVGGRRVGVFKLETPLTYKNKVVAVFEIFEPRQGQEVNSAWEHVEFLVKGSLEDFMENYPNIDWDTSVLDREEFPMLILKLGDGLRAKFPRRGVLEEIERQKEL